DDALIERNEIRVDTRSFVQLAAVLSTIAASATLGGLQIGDDSERVRILDNLIENDIDNDITLGSVQIVNSDGVMIVDIVGWVVNAQDPCNPCLPGDTGIPPGGGDDGDGRIISADALYDIRIAWNRIYDIGLNGIGVVGFFDLRGSD